jgi:hypothetical protein
LWNAWELGHILKTWGIRSLCPTWGMWLRAACFVRICISFTRFQGEWDQGPSACILGLPGWDGRFPWGIMASSYVRIPHCQEYTRR